jgi:hypothetical protein
VQTIPPAPSQQQQQQQQQQSQPQQPQQPQSPDSDAGMTDWCLPHFVDDCPQRSNLLFGCLSTANGVLKNAFVIVQFNQFQQIIGVYTLQTPADSCKVGVILDLFV